MQGPCGLDGRAASLRTNAADRLAVSCADEMTDVSDGELVARTLAGDEAAYAALVRRHYRAAFAVALANLGRYADAEDVCHDAFVRAAAQLESCRQPERFVYWLCTIVRNHAHNYAKREAVRRATALTHDTASSNDDPGRDVEIGELRTQLVRALAELTPAQREVVLLHDLDGWTHQEIASAIRTSEGMSRQHLFHARRRLRELLGADTSRNHFHE